MQDKVGPVERSRKAYLQIWSPVLVMKVFKVFFMKVFRRKSHTIFRELSMLESAEVTEITGCLKPCHYKKYKILGEHIVKSEHYKFSLWAVSGRTRVETEELIYPMSTLVAEFGGTLGLFLGFSFICLWDNIDILKRLMALLRTNPRT